MNRKIFSCWLILCFLVAASFGVGEARPRADIEGPVANAQGIDYKQIYNMTLESLHRWVADQVRMGDEEAPRQIGYFLKDISGDGVPELIVGAIAEEDGTYRYGSELYAVYSCQQGYVKRLFFGGTHQRYTLLSDGRILTMTMDGVHDFGVGVYRIAPDGSVLTCEDYYFVVAADESAQRGDVYHNTSGQSDVGVSEKMNMTPEDVLALGRKLDGQAQPVRLYPFSLYFYEPKEPFTPETSRVWVRRREAVDPGTYYRSRFRVGQEGAHVSLFLSAEKELMNVHVLALRYLDTEAGQPIFATHSLAGIYRFQPEHPVIVDLPIVDAMPAYGLSYEDEEGRPHTFALRESGFDGSLFFEEIQTGGEWGDFGMIFDGITYVLPEGRL